MSAGVFRYTACDSGGVRVGGTLRAASPAAAVTDLRRRSLIVTSLSARASGMPSLSGGVSRRTLVAFFRAFATLVRAGVTIRRALVVAIEQSRDPRLSETLRSVLADVEHGTSLSTAMGRRPHEFSPVQIAMIGAGESGGMLDDSLERVATMVERDHAFRGRLQAALAYPAVVTCAASSLIVFLVVRVIPGFASAFERFGVALPLPTRILLSLGTFGAQPAVWLTAAAFACIAGWAAFAVRSDARTAGAFDRLRLRLPLIGPILKAGAAVRVVRTLALLLRTGVGLADALRVVAPVAGSETYARALASMEEALQRGEPFREPLRRSGVFDPLTVALVGAGEEGGTLDTMLLAAAAHLEVEVEGALAVLTATLEPVLILALGGVVGFVVFSIFLPLYSLAGSIQ